MSNHVKRVANNRRLSFVLVLLAALVGTACDTMSPDRIAAPVTRSADVASSARGVAVVLTQTLQKDSASFAIIGANGGSVSTGAHRLTVPAGAVSEPTIFAIQVLSGSTIYVQLRAFNVRTGQPVTVFATPVKLTLSYSQAYFSDPSILSVIYLPNGLLGDKVVMPSTVNQTNLTVSSWLPHFSDYTLGENRTATADSPTSATTTSNTGW
ncbi:MAG TPA: hypothetical protein VF021_02295 [Longimicrobiales bacterium]